MKFNIRHSDTQKHVFYKNDENTINNSFIESHKRFWIYYRKCLEMTNNTFSVELSCTFLFIVLNVNALCDAYAVQRKHTELPKCNGIYIIFHYSKLLDVAL